MQQERAQEVRATSGRETECHAERSTLLACSNVALDGDAIREARVAITGVGETAYRATSVEKALAGVRLSDRETIERACASAPMAGDARSDTFASAEYRSAMAGVFAARAVAKAAARGRH